MDFYEAVAGRRMVRAFTGEPVDAAVLARVLACAFRGASAGNTSGLELVVLAGDETARYWSVTLPDPGGFRWQGLLAAPVLVVPVVSPDAYASRYAEADKAAAGLGEVAAWPVPYWWVDGGMAVGHVLLAAVAEGLGACLFGQFGHEAAVLAELGVPDGWRALGTVALGHPAPDEPGRSAARPRTGEVHFSGW